MAYHHNEIRKSPIALNTNGHRFSIILKQFAIERAFDEFEVDEAELNEAGYRIVHEAQS